jgi:hypothetical protein
VAALSTIFAGFGFGLTSAGRNTAVALGVGFGYPVIVENVVRGLRPRVDALAAHGQRGDVHHQLADRLPDARALDDRGGAALVTVAAVLLFAAAGLFV